MVFLGVVAAMMVPLQSIIIPEYVNLGRFGLVNNYAGAILVYAALGTPFATFLLATHYRGIPNELIEAAIIDGLGYFRHLSADRASLSPCRPSRRWRSCSSSRSGTTCWWACSSCRTRSSAPSRSDWPPWPPVAPRPSRPAGGSLLSALPAIIVYLIFQRYLVKGLTLGMGK